MSLCFICLISQPSLPTPLTCAFRSYEQKRMHGARRFSTRHLPCLERSTASIRLHFRWRSTIPPWTTVTTVPVLCNGMNRHLDLSFFYHIVFIFGDAHACSTVFTMQWHYAHAWHLLLHHSFPLTAPIIPSLHVHVSIMYMVFCLEYIGVCYGWFHI